MELLREVHLIALKEIERLNLRIAELESQTRQPPQAPIVKPAVSKMPKVIPATANQPPVPKQPEMLNETQVAEYVNMSVAFVRRWRLFWEGAEVSEDRLGGSLLAWRCRGVAQFVSRIELMFSQVSELAHLPGG